MRNASTRNYYGEQFWVPLVSDPTPAASLSLLLAADLYPLDAATLPYVGCARLFDGISDTDRSGRYLSLMVAPSARHGRAALNHAHTFTAGVGTYDSEVWTTTGGSSSPQTITVPEESLSGNNGFARDFRFGTPFQLIVLSGDGVNDAPTASVNRQLELTPASAPYIETVYVTNTASFSVCVTDRVDLETL